MELNNSNIIFAEGGDLSGGFDWDQVQADEIAYQEKLEANNPCSGCEFDGHCLTQRLGHEGDCMEDEE